MPPAQLLDLRALVGDTSDNIPGVKGIGEKGAAKLIAECGEPRDAARARGRGRGQARARGARRRRPTRRGSRSGSRRCATDAPGCDDPAALALREPDRARLRELYERLEFDAPARGARREERRGEPRRRRGRAGAAAARSTRRPRAPREPRRARARGAARSRSADRRATPSALARARARRCAALPRFARRRSSASTGRAACRRSRRASRSRPRPTARLRAARRRRSRRGARRGARARARRPATPLDLAREQARRRRCFAEHGLARRAPGLRRRARGVPARSRPARTARRRSPRSTSAAASRAGRSSRGAARRRSRRRRSRSSRARRVGGRRGVRARRAASAPLARAPRARRPRRALPRGRAAAHRACSSRMEREGVRIDEAALERLAQEFGGELDAARGAHLRARRRARSRSRSPKQLQAVLFEKLKLPGREEDEDRLLDRRERARAARGRSTSCPAYILAHRRLAKLRSTYVDALPPLVNPRTGRIHPTFHQTGAATGRLSSSNPNVQNIPIRSEEGVRIREAFVPAEGGRLLSADYSQVELRILAHFSGDESLREAFRTGEDIHRRTAAEVAAIAPDGGDRRAARAREGGQLRDHLRALGVRAREPARHRDRRGAGDDRRLLRALPAACAASSTRRRERRARAGFVTTLLGRRRYLPDLRLAQPHAAPGRRAHGGEHRRSRAPPRT